MVGKDDFPLNSTSLARLFAGSCSTGVFQEAEAEAVLKMQVVLLGGQMPVESKPEGAGLPRQSLQTVMAS